MTKWTLPLADLQRHDDKHHADGPHEHGDPDAERREWAEAEAYQAKVDALDRGHRPADH